MEAWLAAIQKRLLLLLAASLGIAVLTLPEPDNRRFVAALEEVSAFHAAFDRAATEQALKRQAEVQGALPLSTIEAAARAKHDGGPLWGTAPDALPVRPLSTASLRSLAEISAHASPKARVALGVPDAEALAGSLAWRLARAEQAGPFMVRAVELVAAAVTKADVDLEREVGALRRARLDAQVAMQEAARQVAIFEKRVEFQSAIRSKALFKSRVALREAQDTLDEKTRAHADALQRYAEAERRAERAREPASFTEIPAAAVARVRVEVGSELRTMDVPVPLTTRRVAVEPLRNADFAATRAAGLWDEVKGHDAEGAITIIKSHFNWHMRAVSLLGIELSGALVLALLPCLLPLLLSVLLVGMCRAEESYSPFLTRMPKSAPRVGFQNRALEFMAVVVLPLVAVSTAAVSLVFIGRLAVLPVITGIACLTLSGFAFSRLRQLRDLTLSIVRAHSYPPPPPSAEPTGRR